VHAPVRWRHLEPTPRHPAPPKVTSDPRHAPATATPRGRALHHGRPRFDPAAPRPASATRSISKGLHRTRHLTRASPAAQPRCRNMKAAVPAVGCMPLLDRLREAG
jgi:hypothetical protein